MPLLQFPFYLIARAAPTLGMQSGFKTQTIFRLVQIKVTALLRIMFGFCTAQTDPPFLASSIDRFGASVGQPRARGFSCLGIIGKRYYD